jgi:putative sterol carrier protein
VTQLSCRDFFSSLEAKFKPEKSGQMSAVFQFEVLGEGGGQWAVEVDSRACRVAEGRAESPSLTATISARDFADLINGRLNPQIAFISGKLSIRPVNVELAQAFGRMFF